MGSTYLLYSCIYCLSGTSYFITYRVMATQFNRLQTMLLKYSDKKKGTISYNNNNYIYFYNLPDTSEPINISSGYLLNVGIIE